MDDLILKCLQGEASDGENAKVWEWLKSSPENFQHYRQLRDSWMVSGMVRDLSENEIDQRYEKMKSRIHTGRKKPVRVSGVTRLVPEWLKIAAVFVFAFLLGAVIINFLNKGTFDGESNHEYVVEAPYGAKVKMSLADGTRVWLNAGSKLTYFDGYNKINRNVSLTGEGYFEVAKDPKNPFYVYARGVKIKAIGTAFNVKAYPDEHIVETTLVEGKVSVSQGNRKIMLEPHQRASFTGDVGTSGTIRDEKRTEKDTGNREFSTENTKMELDKNINTDLYTSWRGKRWIFEGENMADFVKKLERRYDVQILITNPRLSAYKITGSIEQQTLDQLLNALRLTIPVSYQIKNKEVFLTLDEQLEKEYEPLMKRP